MIKNKTGKNMKKTLISLATASLIASSAVAADKGIDFTTTGQAVVYYQTHNDGKSDSADLFNQKASSANVGIQLDIASDLQNGFTFGSQLTYLGTSGLEKNLVSNVNQVGGQVPVPNFVDTNEDGKKDNIVKTTNELALTKIFIAKQIANTTVKIGRQELPQSLSPLAFTEGWDVFKNTFDAVLVVNTDIKDTTLVGAYVGRSTGMDLSTVDDLTVSSSAGALNVSKTAYMLTAQNKSLPMTTLTGSYYALAGIAAADSADVVWMDASVQDKSLPMGFKAGVQGGMIMAEADNVSNTSAMGVKASIAPMQNLRVCGAFSYVSGEKDAKRHLAAVKNTGTGVLTPLYTQMIKNADAIALDNNTYMLKGVYSLGDMGKVTARTTYTQAGQRNLNGNGIDYNELDLMYQAKVSGVNLLAAYVYQAWDTKDDKSNDMVRFVARYNF